MAYDERRPSGVGTGTVTIVLIALNILVFLVVNVGGRKLLDTLALIPASVVQAGEWWRIITYMFVHSSWSHIFFNMLALFLFGTQLEHRMRSGEFLLFYLLCGIGAGIVTMLVNNAGNIGDVRVVGASGAVYGLLLAFAGFFPDDRLYIFGLIPLRAPVAVAAFAGIEIVLQLANLQTGVAHIAHLSGLAFAYVYLLVRWRINALSLFFRRR